MKTMLITYGILLVLCTSVHGQPLIGMSREQVADFIKEEHREFSEDQRVVSKQFNYLKFVNRGNTRTWIAYFSEGDICTGTKLVCDYSEFDEVQEELDHRYRKIGEREWEYTHGTDTFRVNLTREEWYFTVREKRK